MTVTLPPAQPRFTWDNIAVGDDLGLVSGRVSESHVRAHAFAIDESAARYLDREDGNRLVPSTLFINDLLKLFLLGYDCTPPMVGGLHTRAVIDIVRPVAVGEEVTVTGSHVAKYIRRGRRYRSCRSAVTGSDGVEAIRMLATETVGFDVLSEQDSGEMPENWAADLPRVTTEVGPDDAPYVPGAEPRAGDVIRSSPRSVSYEQSIVFSGFPFSWAQPTPQPLRRGIHTEPAIAEAAGYPAPVAQGLMSASHIISTVLEDLGDSAPGASSFSFSFIAPVLVGSTLTAVAVIDEVTAEAVHLHAFAKDEQERIVTVGHARVQR